MKNSNPSQIAVSRQKYSAARSNLLLMLALTAVNLILLAAQTETMLLFSATVPYYAVAFGMVLESSSILYIGIAIAAVIILLYLLCWILSKKHFGWMVVALILFVIDTLCMVLLYVAAEDFSGVIDALIHIWVLYYLVTGVTHGIKLNNAAYDNEVSFNELYTKPQETEADSSFSDTVVPSSPVRRADDEVKSRVLVEANALGHHILFRRVKRINELVIDGYVYDEVELLIETAHSLSAEIDGHSIRAEFDGAMTCFIIVDDEIAAKKKRFY